MPQRLEKLIELAREPMHWDVDLGARIGGFRSVLPCFLSAFGSTEVASGDAGQAASRQAGALGMPMVIGENLVPVKGYGRMGGSMVGRIRAYASELTDGLGGVAIQQSTEDADAEVWNLVYSDCAAQPLLDSGRLAFELKVGQGAKPGLGGMTVLDELSAGRMEAQFGLDRVVGPGQVLRCSSAGTFTEEILRQQVHLLRNNFPRARAWVKLHPGRDIAQAASVAWEAGADAVTVDGAEGGTGWAPSAFLDHVGLPLSECLRRIGRPPSCLLVCGRMWEGARAVKALALGAAAVGLGRAALPRLAWSAWPNASRWKCGCSSTLLASIPPPPFRQMTCGFPAIPGKEFMAAPTAAMLRCRVLCESPNRGGPAGQKENRMIMRSLRIEGAEVPQRERAFPVAGRRLAQWASVRGERGS
ncbi:MAG: glutamate synthase-related protein [Streptosporangiaceae bacterium]